MPTASIPPPPPTAPVAAYTCNQQTISEAQFFALATTPAHNVAVEACAGAGKTQMLVTRVIRILLETDAQPAQIVALTFTRKACAEMLERVNQSLQILHGCDESTLSTQLQRLGYDGPQSLNPRLRLRAKQVYPALLQAPQGLQFLTFDAWFYQLLQRAPMALTQQLGLPLQAQLQQDSTHLQAATWARFEQALLDPDQEHLQVCYQQLLTLTSAATATQLLASVLTEHALFTLATSQHDLTQMLPPWPQVFPAMAKLWSVDASSPLPASAVLTDPVLPLWHCPSQGDLFTQLAQQLGAAARAKKPPSKTLQQIADGLTHAWQTQDFSALLDALCTKDGGFRVVKVADDAVLQRLTQAQQLLLTLQQIQAQHRAWAIQTCTAPLAQLLHQCHTATKQAAAVIDLGDVTLAVYKLMSQQRFASWLQSTLGAQLRHVLIDEFQDTSPLQWQILKQGLSSFAGSGGNSLSIFIVGDPKQSIYGFRGADARVFTQAQQFLQQGFAANILRTDHTRRCAQQIVHTVNTVLGLACAEQSYTGFYPHTTAVPSPGCVAALPQISAPPAAKPTARAKTAAAAADTQEDISTESAVLDTPWRHSLTTPRTPPAEEKLIEREVAQMAQHIAARIASGTNPGHVMVLGRKHEPLSRLRHALRLQGVASVMGEKMALIDTPEVQDVLALLQALINPGNSLALAHALKSPLIGLHDEDLKHLALTAFALRTSHAAPWWQALQHAHAEIAAQLQHWRDLRLHLSGAAWLQHIAVQGQWLARYASASSPSLWPASEARLMRLLHMAHDIAPQLGSRSSDLLRNDLVLRLQESPSTQLPPRRWLRQLMLSSEQVYDPGSAQAVRLLTVHAAKGLQAPVVYLLDTQPATQHPDRQRMLIDWPAQAPYPEVAVFLESMAKPPPSLQTRLAALQQRQAQEDLNLLYVALTRAQDTLVLSSHARSNRHKTWWQRVHPHAHALTGVDSADASPATQPPAQEPEAAQTIQLAAVHHYRA